MNSVLKLCIGVGVATVVGSALQARPVATQGQAAPAVDCPLAKQLARATSASLAGGTSAPNAAAAASAAGVTLRALVTPNQFAGGQTNGAGCTGHVSASGREYAIIGLNRGVGFVEITNPSSPQIVHTYVSGFSSTWREVAAAGSYAYSVSEGGDGIQVFDLSSIDGGVVTHVGNVTTGGSTATHTVQVDDQGKFLYRNGGSSNGIRIYDIGANPSNPPFVGSWSTKYVHDSQIVWYTHGPYAGKQIAFCCTGSNQTLTILDVTNKASITVLADVSYPQSGYSHQGWLSQDRTHFYLDDEFDETNYGLFSTKVIFNVTSLAGAYYVTSWNNGNTAIDHNCYVKGSLLYQANYRSGLRIADISNPTAPVEVAFYDTYPADDQPQYNSLWNTYPYLPSGNVIASDREQGLWVLWVPHPYNEPLLYCAAKLNSLGCLPSLDSTGAASASAAAPFVVTASDVINNKTGLFFYGYAWSSLPFHGGTMCVAPPRRRNPLQSSGGTAPPANDCSGTFTIDYNAYIQSGADPMLLAGTTVYAQNWSRDPAGPFTDSTTNAIAFSIDL